MLSRETERAGLGSLAKQVIVLKTDPDQDMTNDLLGSLL